jgi:hypothetical protein
VSKKRTKFCVVGRNVTEDSFRKDPQCERHPHISWQELNKMHTDGGLQPIGELRSIEICDERDARPDYLFEWLIAGKAIRFKRHIPLRGMSSKFGAYLAESLKAKAPWAQAMVAQMRGERETPAVL